MLTSVSIVMYHYVRDLERTRFPRLTGLDLDDFRGQLAYIERHYEVVPMSRVVAALAGDADLPPNALVLTFDDGYAEHYATVCPLLVDHGLVASFFPPVAAIRDHQLLDVNRIHFVLAAVEDHVALARELYGLIDESRGEYEVEPAAEIYARWAKPFHYGGLPDSPVDGADTIFVKRALQVALPQSLRARLASELFRRHVTADETAFAEELYVTEAQLREMREAGMELGSHTYSHRWLSHLTDGEQVAEIDRSLEFLASLGVGLHRWVMCYPYGDVDDRCVRLLRERGCAAGVTTRFDIARGADDPLRLPRLDTRDLPFRADAQPNRWTTAVLSNDTTKDHL